jgi:hypothetical protein
MKENKGRLGSIKTSSRAFKKFPVTTRAPPAADVFKNFLRFISFDMKRVSFVAGLC